MVNLNSEQREIVEYEGSKPLSVEAGPGAGKTRVIIERVRYLLTKKNINPESLLVITFTRKAANELKDRLADSDIAKSDIDLMQISTIHGFCSKILEKHGAIGFDIIDDDLKEKNNMFISKHLKDLGFEKEFTISKREIKDIIRKYDEYTTFKVNTEKLVQYIKQTRPISDDYLEFVRTYMDENNGKFPKNEIRNDKNLKKSYYNAKYLKIAESYPKYLKLLEDNNLTDFGLMQVNTLEFLKQNPETKYKNVLIDEFQDTDPTQMQIFEILMEHADTFTVVGDKEQSIYGFRGSIDDYFKRLYENPTQDIEKKSLSINHRSTEEIIDFSEKFIEIQRSKNISYKEAVGNRNLNRDMYYMVSDSNKSEASQIIQLIKHLKQENKIYDYSDIGILARSVKNDTNCINPLIELLEDEKIPYQVKGRNDLLDRDEIKSILTLIYHVIKDEDENPHIFNKWDKDWLNLKAFTGENFNQVLFDLSDETKSILNKVQDDFEQEVLRVEKEVWKELKGKTSKKQYFERVFDRDEEVLIEIFKRVERPFPTNDNLIKWGIYNEDDLKFFYTLNGIHNEYLSEDIETEKKDTILNIFFRLLTITDAYFDEEYINNNENKNRVENIALLSNSLYNYEQVGNPYDLAGAFWFLYHNIENYGAYADDSEGIQIMTVHKSKGLEFPIVIVASLHENKFPLSFRDPNPEGGYINGSPVYYTPNECLEYKTFESIDEEKIAHDEEEERIVYVALTRAEDTLILSSLSPSGSENLLDKAIKYQNHPDLKESEKKQYFEFVPKGHPKVQEVIDKCDYCKPLRYDWEVIEEIERNEKREQKSEDKGETIKLSFTSLENFQQCPFKYKLSDEFKLKASEKNYINDGIFIHKAFEVINKQIKENDNIYIGDGAVNTIVSNLFHMAKLEETDEDDKNKLKRITEDILYYYHNIGCNFEIIDCEVPFYIKFDSYSLNGVIDLIYKTEDGKLGILDYKNTEYPQKHKEKYRKQLYTYVLGLRDENHKYSNQHIDELKIYAIKAKQLIPILYNEIEIKEMAENISKIASNIETSRFNSVDGDHCDKCPYLRLCKSQETPGGIPMISCPNCDTKVSFGSKFCTECGYDFTKKQKTECPSCGNKIKPEMKFCSECGQKL